MATKTKKDKWTSDEVVKLIRNKYSGQDYASFEQVADGTGAHAHSWIDVAAFGLWPSKGLHRLAFEVKVSRADYLNEIHNPNKNAWVKECFNEFWYVAPSGVINDVSEVPEGCGWMQATRGGLRIKRQATIKQDALMDESLFASLCRSAQSELTRARSDVRKDALAEDTGYQRALGCQVGVKKFLESRGLNGYDWDTEEEVIAKLEKATLDAQARADRDHVLLELEHFQTRILELSDLFSVIGAVSLLECDESGIHLHHHWGGEDISSLASKKILAKRKGRDVNEYRQEEAKKFTRLAEDLLGRARVMCGEKQKRDGGS